MWPLARRLSGGPGGARLAVTLGGVKGCFQPKRLCAASPDGLQGLVPEAQRSCWQRGAPVGWLVSAGVALALLQLPLWAHG